MPWFVQGEDGSGNTVEMCKGVAWEEPPRDNVRSAKAFARFRAEQASQGAFPGVRLVAVFEAESAGGRVTREHGAWHVDGSGTSGDPVRVEWHAHQPRG